MYLNLYTKTIFEDSLSEKHGGIKNKWQDDQHMRNADNSLIIITFSQQEQQRIMNKVVEISRESGLMVNTGKTECMLFSKRANQTVAYTSMGQR